MSKIMNTVTVKNINIVHAIGEYLIDSKGIEYLDWFADVGTVNLGYSISGLINEMSVVPQHIPNTLGNPLKERTASALCELTYMDKVFFCNSGSEAVEAAIKIVRKWNKEAGYNKRNTIWTYKGGFHGRTYGAISAGDGAPYHYKGFEPHLEGFKHFTELDEIDWETAQAVMLATMYGNNDAIIYPKDYILYLWKKCQYYKIPLVLDEVQVGSGRIGTFNGYDYYGITPDIVCLGKGIACGIPTGVTLAKGEFADVFTPGTHYSTFGGSPLSCVGIEHLMSVWKTGHIGNNVNYLGELLKIELSKMNNIGNVRGKGMWIAFDVAGDMAFNLSDELLKNGMFVPTFRKNAIKITPMLNMKSIDEGLSKIRASIKTVFGTV